MKTLHPNKPQPNAERCPQHRIAIAFAGQIKQVSRDNPRGTAICTTPTAEEEDDGEEDEE
jgi:hypothetical protein